MADESGEAIALLVLAHDIERGSAFWRGRMPGSVRELFRRAEASTDWIGARSREARALIFASLLAADPDLAATFRADLAAGRLGLGDGPGGPTDAETSRVAAAIRDAAPAVADDDAVATVADDDAVAAVAAELPDDPQDHDQPVPQYVLPPDGQQQQQREQDGEDGLPAGGGWRDRGHPVPGPHFKVDDGAGERGLVPPHGGPAHRPPAKAAAAADDPAAQIETWLNAELDDGDAPMQVGVAYTLEVAFDDHARPGAHAQHGLLAAPRVDQDSIEVTVQLASEDFDVPEYPQILSVDRHGRSSTSARFSITPRQAEASRLSIVVARDGNFVQRMDLTYDVGASAAPEVTLLGRPAATADLVGPREATLQILKVDDGYRLQSMQGLPGGEAVIHLSEIELAKRVQAIRTVLLNWVEERDELSSGLDLGEQDSAQFLAELSDAGIELYSAIFEGPGASESLQRVGAWLRETMSKDDVILQVSADDFPVPWPLMYLTADPENDAREWDRFIGARHVVELAGLEPHGIPPAPQIPSAPELSVGVFYNETLDAEVAVKPVTQQRDYWAATGAVVREGTTWKEFSRLALDPASADRVLYLYCHAENDDQDSWNSRITLSDTSFTLAKLRSGFQTSKRFANSPIVFLNACESGQLSPQYRDSFVTYFRDKGARGVIATEAKTPGLFASAFAQAFFTELFDGQPVGAAMLTVRRRFLRDHRNPLGLLYAVYCDPDTVITPALTHARP